MQRLTELEKKVIEQDEEIARLRARIEELKKINKILWHHREKKIELRK